MAAQPVTLHLPQPLYERLQKRAEGTHRSIEDELLEVVAAAMPAETLPDDLAAAISSLHVLDDESLWRAARNHLPRSIATRMEALHEQRAEYGLTPTQQEELQTYLHQYETYMLIRARAAAILHERGHDVSVILNGQ